MIFFLNVLRTFDRKIDSVEKNLLTEIKATNTRIEGVRTELLTEIKATNTRIEGVRTELLTEIKATNTRIDSLEKSMSRSFTVLTIVMRLWDLVLLYFKYWVHNYSTETANLFYSKEINHY